MYFLIDTSFSLRLVDILCHHLVLGFDGDEDVFELALSFCPEHVKGHWSAETQFAMAVAIEVFLLNAIDAAAFITPRIEVVEVLNEGRMGEGNGQCIHGMVAMVVSFGPIFDASDLTSILVFIGFSKAKTIVFVPVEFLHDIDELPVFAQAVGDTSDSGNDLRHHVLQNLTCFLGNVLRVAQVAVDEAIGNVGFAHEQFIVLGFADDALFVEVVNFRFVLGRFFLTPFAKDVVVGGGVALFDIDATCFQSLIREGIIEKSSLRNDVLYVEVLAEKLVTRDIGVRVKRFEAVVLQLHIELISNDVIAADVLDAEL